MDIESLYKQRAEEYRIYSIQQGVYTSKLQEARQNVLNSLDKARNSCQSITDARIKESTLTLLNTIEDKSLEDPKELKSVLDTVNEHIKSLETEVRRLLE